MVGYLKMIVKSKWLLPISLLGIAIILAYFPTFRGNFVLDDEGQILRNPLITSLAHIPQFFRGGTFYGGNTSILIGSFYRPVMMIVFAVGYRFWGLNPTGYHAVSIGLHIINSFLVYIFISQLLTIAKNRSAGPSWLALGLALVFAVHPMFVSAVAYAAAMNELLFFGFGMSALLLIMKRSGPTIIVMATGLFALAILSKETAIVLMAIAGTYLYLFRRRDLPVYLVASTVLIVSYLALRCGLAHMCSGRTGAGQIATLPFGGYLLQVPAMVAFYFRTFIFPHHLATSQEWIVTAADWRQFTLPLIFDTVLIVIALGLLLQLAYAGSMTFLKTKSSSAYDTARGYGLAAGLLITAILLHLHIAPLEFTVDEHWFYLPAVGLLGMIAVALPARPIPRHRQRLLAITGGFIIMILIIRTNIRVRDWHDNYRLFSHDIGVVPGSASLATNLGTELFRRGDISGARRYFLASVTLDPHRPVGWTNLGIVAELQHHDPEALNYYHRAIAASDYPQAYINAIVLLNRTGRHTEARDLLVTARRRFPDNAAVTHLTVGTTR